MAEIGERLREARLKCGFTQAELAVSAGVSRDIVAKLEQGQRESARMTTLAALARALDVDTSDLVGQYQPPLVLSPADTAAADQLAATLAEVQALPVTRKPRTTALYRYYDDEDRLLYVGIADRVLVRQRSHMRASTWMEFAARSTITRWLSRQQALAAEKTAIANEEPLFNLVHNSSPAAQLRLVEYLIEKRRTDLLAASVSRG